MKNQQELKYTASTEVLTGDSYSYRLHYSSQDTAKANNLVLFDVLENNAGEREHWKGTLQSVDVSSALRKGVDAKVLYSMKKDIILSHDDAGLKGDANIEDETIWSAEKPADMSKVTAVAIDMRNTVEGTPFVLESQQQVFAILHMKAPIDIIKQDMEKKILAYNTSWVNANTQVSNVEWQDSLLETTETTVAIREPEMEIHKTSTPASGTQDHPTKVKKHDEINYDISVKNGETSFLLNAIKVEDILPSGLDIQLDAIAWYLGNDSTKQQLVKDSQFVEVMQDAKNKQKLIFTIEALQVEQELHFVIPTKVTDNGDDTLFVNTAKIIEVHQHSFEKESETTYHELDITTADFLFYYPSYIGENHEVTTEFKNLLEDVETAKSFYEKMAAEIHRSPSTIAITAAKTATASAPSVTLTDIGLGYYLICAKHGVEQVYTPTGFNIAPVEEEGTWSVNDQTVTMKSSTPTIVKTVIDPTDTTVAITDSVCYQLTAQIPTYLEDASAITFTIGDKLSEGLTLKPDTIAVKDASGKEIAATNYDVKKDPGKTAKLTDYTFEIVFKEAYIKTNPMLNVQVTYDAEVNDKALTMDALKNIAYIGYNHDPYDIQSYKEKTTENWYILMGLRY